MKQNKWISLFVFVALCLFVEFFASYWTMESVSTWYPTLNKPSWTPPSWLFGPVWTVLYLMIAISGWMIYSSENSRHRTFALSLYGIQLALNFLWSFFFFSLQRPLLGLIDITLLCVFIILTMLKAWQVRPLASLLLLPYLIWVLFATALNASIWLLNK